MSGSPDSPREAERPLRPAGRVCTKRTPTRQPFFLPDPSPGVRPWAIPLLAMAGLLAVPAAAAEPVPVSVDLHVISFGNYDQARGTYTLDFYLIFRWDAEAAPDGFTPERFEFMNGRASSKDLLFAGNGTDGREELWYRIQANLYSEPRFARYPYDRQVLRMELEDAVNPLTDLVYVPEISGTGLADDVRVAGWRIDSAEASIEVKDYPFEEPYSRFTYTIEVTRPALSTTLRSFLPPLTFMIVAGIQFLLHPSKVGNRLGLGTGMLISAVGFHVSQTINLPALGVLTLFDRFMIATYVFIACSLAVSTAIAYDQDYWPDKDHTHAINRTGFGLTVAIPVVVFVLLTLL
jgi:hypothetical protein